MILDRIRRVTRDGRWIPEIDGLRFIAIAAVVLFHLLAELTLRAGAFTPVVQSRYGWFYRMVQNGDRGVSLFFVISGMILAMPFARYYLARGKEVSLRKYYMRRVTRLEPPYVLSVLIFVAIVALYQPSQMEPGYWKHALASTFYLHNLIYGTMSPVNNVSWSLEVEIQFYVFAPLVMMLFRVPGKTLRRGLMLALIVVIGLLQLPWWDDLRVGLSLLFHLQYFVAGLLVADIFVLDLDGMKTNWLWDGGALVALGLMLGLNHELHAAHVVLPYCFIVLCLAAMRGVVFRRFVGNGWIAVIGGMCYSIYLLHFVAMAAVFKVTRHLLRPQFDYLTNFAIQTVAVCVPILVITTAFFLLVERPCMDPNWPGKLWHRVTGRSEHDVDALDTAGVEQTKT